jgi:NAD dependent epimerase/dehydratase family enzyme
VIRQSFDSGAGVVLGSGRQWLPWISIDDAVRLIVETVKNPAYAGPVNVAAPQPARYAEVAAALGAALDVPWETHVPAEAVAAQLGGASELLLSSARMLPARATAAGFTWRHPSIADAMADLAAPALAGTTPG